MSCINVLLHTVSGPVTNLTADFTTTSTLSFNITIMWNAPVQPNGDILRYDYSLTETETAAVRISGNTTELSVNDLPLTDVEPYTSYTVTVVAVNSVGDGESANITLLSPETGTSDYIYTIVLIILLVHKLINIFQHN